MDFFKTLPIPIDADPISIGILDGWNLAAPWSFWIADDELRKAVAGGCGPGGIGDFFVPDRMYGLSMKPACKIHDWTFAVWNCKAGFDLSNNLFKNNMIRINEQHDGWQWVKRLRLLRIKKYFGAVHFFGEPAYYNAHLKLV